MLSNLLKRPVFLLFILPPHSVHMNVYLLAKTCVLCVLNRDSGPRAERESKVNPTIEDNKNTYPDKRLTERLHKTHDVTVVAYRVKKKKIKYT